MHCCCISVTWCSPAMTEESEALVVNVPEKPLCPHLACGNPSSCLHQQIRRAVLALRRLKLLHIVILHFIFTIFLKSIP